MDKKCYIANFVQYILAVYHTYVFGVGELSVWLRASGAFTEDSGLIPNTHKVDSKHQQLQLEVALWTLLTSVIPVMPWIYVHMWRQYSHIHKIRQSKRKTY